MKYIKHFKSLFSRHIFGFISPSIKVTEDYYQLINCRDDSSVELFESKLSEYLGGGETITFGSGRMSFYSLLKIWGIGIGDEVALTGFTCSVMANAVLRCGATPIYIDVDSETLGMDPTALRKCLTKHTKVVVAQHTFGIPCKIDEIIKIARDNGSFVIEDCALSLGSEYKGVKLGNFADAAIFSTDHTKPLNTLIGGFVYTLNKELANKVVLFRNGCSSYSFSHQRMLIDTYIKEYEMEAKGHKRYVLNNYLLSFKRRIGLRLPDTPFLNNDTKSNVNDCDSIYPYPAKLPPFLAAIGIKVLEQYIKNSNARKEWMNRIITVLSEYEVLPKAYFDKNCNIIPLRIAYVLSNKKQSDYHFIDDWIWFKKPIVATTETLESFGYVNGSCPNSEIIGNNIMNIPILFNEKEQDVLIKKLRKIYR